MTEALAMPEATETFDERVARVRALLHSLPQGRQAMTDFTPAGMVQTDPNIVDFSDWSQFSQWPQSS